MKIHPQKGGLHNVLSLIQMGVYLYLTRETRVKKVRKDTKTENLKDLTFGTPKEKSAEMLYSG